MNARETVEAIHRHYANRDLAAVMALMNDDITLVSAGDPGSEIAVGSFEGRAAVAARLGGLSDIFEFERYQTIQTVAELDWVAARVTVVLTVRETQERVKSELAQFWLVHNGRASRWIEYFDTALAARVLPPMR